MAKNVTVSKFLLPHSDKNEKHQFGLKLRVVKPEIQLDFTVKFPNGVVLKLTKQQYNNLTTENYNLIEINKHRIIKAVNDLISNKITLIRETINKRLEQNYKKEFLEMINSYDEYPVIEEHEIDQLDEILDKIDKENVGQDIIMEDLGSMILDKKIELDNKKLEQEILKSNTISNTLQRAKKQYQLIPNWDKMNLVLQIGNLFTMEKDNGKPLIHSINRGLLNNLYDFILNEHEPNDIRSFNVKYCKRFIKYLVHNGVIKSSLGRTAMELNDGKYDQFFKTNKHQILCYSTFIDKVKALNSIVKNLKEYGINISVNKQFKSIDFIDNNSVNTEKGSNTDHHLKPDEVKMLLDSSFKKKELELAKNVFLILVFCGGLRGIKNFDVEMDFERGTLDVLHSKVNKRVNIPIWNEMNKILAKYNNKFPDFPDEQELTFNLRAVANELKWIRLIKTVNTKLSKKKRDKYYFKTPLHKIIDQRFARKTFVNYARHEYGLKDWEIIQYTGHADVQTLIHYMGELTIEDMKKRITRKQA